MAQPPKIIDELKKMEYELLMWVSRVFFPAG
jgi:hypothetical protein